VCGSAVFVGVRCELVSEKVLSGPEFPSFCAPELVTVPQIFVSTGFVPRVMTIKCLHGGRIV